jgi:hypothetical protein
MAKNILQPLLFLFFIKHSYPENKASSSFLAYVANLNKYMCGKSPLISSNCLIVSPENYLNYGMNFLVN